VHFIGCSFLRVFNFGEIYVALIGVGMENIVVFDGVLLASKYQVYPFMQIIGDMRRFQSKSMLI